MREHEGGAEQSRPADPGEGAGVWAGPGMARFTSAGSGSAGPSFTTVTA